MTITTIDLDTELSAVNSILGSIGQAPVTTLGSLTTNASSTDEVVNTFENPEIAFIYNILREVNQDVQNEGWHFNTEYNVEFIRDNAPIFVTPRYLRFDLSENQVFRAYDFVRRDGKLYDLISKTDQLTGTFYLDIVYLQDFEKIPPVFRRYIISRASVRAATQLVNNSELVKLLQIQEAQTRASCMDYECQQGDHSYMGWPQGTSYRAFQPYKALRR